MNMSVVVGFGFCATWLNLPSSQAIYDQVGHKRIRPSTASMRRAWGGEVVDLVSAMWDQDPAARPPMTQVVLEIQVLITAEKERLAAERRRRD